MLKINRTITQYALLFILLLLVPFCIVRNNTKFREPKKDLRKVYLRLSWETQSQFAGYYVAKHNKYYEEEGIDLIIRTSLNNVNISATVANGVDHFGEISLENLITDLNRFYPVKNIAQIYQDIDIVLLARKEDGIFNLEDFKGKVYATWWGNNDIMIRTLFKKQHIPLEVIFYQKPWSLDAFINKQVQIIPAFYANEFHTILMNGYKQEDLSIFSYKDYGMDFPGGCLIASDKLIERDPELVFKFLKASIKGWNYAFGNKEEAVSIMQKYAKLNKEHEMFMLDVIEKNIDKNFDGSPIGFHDVTKIQKTIDFLKESGQITRNITPEDIVYDKFIKKIGAKH